MTVPKRVNELRIVLEETVTADEVSLCAWQQDWEPIEIFEKTEEQPYCIVWVTDDRKSSIHYVEDFYICVTYLVLKGEKLQDIEKIVKRSLRTYTLEKICNKMEQAKTSDDYILGIYYLGVATTCDYDSKIFDKLSKSILHDNFEIRKAAMLAIAYVGWREFLNPLTKLKKYDSDAKIRKIAALTIDLIKQH